jgi:carboxyl-terminal processing protease
VTEGYRVKNVFPGSPAEKSGIIPGCIITMVNNHSVAGITMNNFTDLTKGNIGDTMRLAGLVNGNHIEYTVIIDNYYLQSVFTDSLNATSAVVSITGFHLETISPGGTEEEFFLAMEKLSWAENILFDVRGNGGGILAQALECVSFIVPAGLPSIKLSFRGINGLSTTAETKDSIIVSQRKSKLFSKNFAVVVDEGTASAAEVFVTILKTLLPKTKIVGTRTFGKATGQVMVLGPDSAYARITCMQFSPISGGSYDIVGITPDRTISEGENAIELADSLLSSHSIIKSIDRFNDFADTNAP